MEGVWSVQQITLHWTSRAFANVTSYICLHLFHSEVHDWISYKLLTNFELNNFNQFFFLFQFCHICFVWFFGVCNFYAFWSDVRGPFSDVLDVALPNEENPLFFLADGRPIADILQPSKRFAGNSSYPGILFVGKSQRF